MSLSGGKPSLHKKCFCALFHNPELLDTQEMCEKQVFLDIKKTYGSKSFVHKIELICFANQV